MDESKSLGKKKRDKNLLSKGEKMRGRKKAIDALLKAEGYFDPEYFSEYNRYPRPCFPTREMLVALLDYLKVAAKKEEGIKIVAANNSRETGKG
jgi:hypothetical protein